MEITDELRQYFAQTEKHREELSEYHWMDMEREAKMDGNCYLQQLLFSRLAHHFILIAPVVTTVPQV